MSLLEKAHQQETEDRNLNNISVDELEIKKQFQVFYDPTFREFIDIIGHELDEDLPLYVQLYLLK